MDGILDFDLLPWVTLRAEIRLFFPGDVEPFEGSNFDASRISMEVEISI
jgi:hypothetical protein